MFAGEEWADGFSGVGFEDLKAALVILRGGEFGIGAEDNLNGFGFCIRCINGAGGGGKVPESRDAVIPGGEDGVFTGNEGGIQDSSAVSQASWEWLSVGYVPDDCRFVEAAGDAVFFVGGQVDGGYVLIEWEWRFGFCA